MTLDAIVVGAFQANCYVLGCSETRRALVIDPGDDPQSIENLLERHNLEPEAYLLTHGHIDHVGAATPLREKFGGKILLHEADLFLYEKVSEQGMAYGMHLPRSATPDRYLVDGETVSWGKLEGTVIHTPGHSPGGICLHVAGSLVGRNPFENEAGASVDAPDWVFCGDTLFQGSIGRTDLPGGSHEELLRVIREKLLSLPDATVIAPGHGPLSSIAAEKRINPFLQGSA